MNKPNIKRMRRQQRSIEQKIKRLQDRFSLPKEEVEKLVFKGKTK